MNEIHATTSRNRSGLTLGEFLGGIFIAWFLPTVQQIGEAAQRLAYTNNLKQIDLAFHSHPSSLTVFPSGYVSSTTPSGNNRYERETSN